MSQLECSPTQVCRSPQSPTSTLSTSCYGSDSFPGFFRSWAIRISQQIAPSRKHGTPNMLGPSMETTLISDLQMTPSTSVLFPWRGHLLCFQQIIPRKLSSMIAYQLKIQMNGHLGLSTPSKKSVSHHHSRKTSHSRVSTLRKTVHQQANTTRKCYVRRTATPCQVGILYGGAYHKLFSDRPTIDSIFFASNFPELNNPSGVAIIRDSWPYDAAAVSNLTLEEWARLVMDDNTDNISGNGSIDFSSLISQICQACITEFCTIARYKGNLEMAGIGVSVLPNSTTIMDPSSDCSIISTG